MTMDFGFIKGFMLVCEFGEDYYGDPVMLIDIGFFRVVIQ